MIRNNLTNWWGRPAEALDSRGLAEISRAISDAHHLASDFRRPAAYQHASDYLRRLIADVERKNGWQLVVSKSLC